MLAENASTTAPSSADNSAETATANDGDVDDLILELEREEDNDDVLTNLRERRMAQLRKEMEERTVMQQKQHGTYTEVQTEKEVLDITTKTTMCIVHFYHKEFRRCLIMDKHLQILARKYFKTRFIKVEVSNAPFLVDRLHIQMLPCVICFMDGISCDRVVGFEELGNTDTFETSVLERRLSKTGVILLKEGPNTINVKHKTIRSGRRGAGSSDDDSD